MILLHVIRHRDIVATMLRQWDTYRAPCFFHCGDLSLCVYMYLMHNLGQQSNYTGSEHTDLLLRAPVYCPPDSQGPVFTQLPLTNSQVSLGVALFYPHAPPLPPLRPLFSLQQVSPPWVCHFIPLTSVHSWYWVCFPFSLQDSPPLNIHLENYPPLLSLSHLLKDTKTLPSISLEYHIHYSLLLNTSSP